MRLLLVSATAFEIRETSSWLNNPPFPDNIPDIDLLISGVGQLRTVYALDKQVRSRRPDLIIQAGFAGGQNPEDTGKVYAIRTERIADLGAQDSKGFRDIFELGLDNPDQFPFRQGSLVNPYRSLIDWTGLPITDGQTVNTIKSADLIECQRNDHPFVESMEGAALHFVCLMEKIPFLQIRSISNVIGERDKSQWKMEEAGNILHDTLVSLMQKLKQSDETLFRI